MKRNHGVWSAVTALAVTLAVGPSCSLDELLKAENPAELPVSQLNDVRLLQVQLNGVIDAFQRSYAEPIIEWSNFMTDEMLTGLNWEGHARVNQRIVSYLEGPTEDVFEEMSRAHRMAVDLSERIRVWQADADTTSDADLPASLATSLVFAGYSAVVLAENMCQAVISPDPDNPSATILSQLETFEVAVPYLTEALNVARGAGEDQVANLALTGLARAYLGLGSWTDAAISARQVESDFAWWMEFMDVDGVRNPLEGISQGGNFTHGIHPRFTGIHPSFDGTGFAFTDNNIIAPQTDPRIQHEITDRTGHNRLTRLYKLFQGLRYSDYTGQTIAPRSAACPNCTGTPQRELPFIAENDTDILLADYVEAQHHLHEALIMGLTVAAEAEVRAFVNSRRAVGNQAPVNLSGRALITELRNQRARDLFMGGFRLPDLRRWTRFDAGMGPFGGGSYFPTGPHPNAQWGNYDEWTCFPIPLSEYEGNPSLQRPADPNEPPGI
ncbi:MAG: RagB/SusD family nutrient uptake outer membrane protein [Gemmatimonadaceae bacterium]